MSIIRYQIIHEYDGTPYHGWQRQTGLPTVQEALEQALHQFAPQASEMYVSGRTDAGVHALGQVAHVDLYHRVMDPFRVKQALNAHLVPHPIAVLDVSIAPPPFHARFSAIQRVYRYRIVNRRAPLALERQRAWWVIPPLDLNRMQAGCDIFKGTWDLTTFRAAECQASSPIRTIDDAWVERGEGDVISFCVKARSFLHHQVRNMAGALKYMGEGRWSEENLLRALDARDRKCGAVTAPPWGLYLERVVYS